MDDVQTIFQIAALAAIGQLAACGPEVNVDDVQSDPSQHEKIVGTWVGTLSAGADLRLIFHIESVDGELTGTLDSPDQGATGLLISRAAFDGTRVVVSLDSPSATYEGTYTDARINGQWHQGGLSLELNLVPFDTGAAQRQARAFAPVVGSWQGVLDTGGTKLRLVVHIEDSDIGIIGKLDSPDQGQLGIGISELSFDGTNLVLGLPALGASYEGTLVDGELKGKWSQGGTTFALELTRTAPGEDVSAMVRPQTPQPPFSYREEAVSFGSAGDDAVLAGTLTLPASGSRFPAAIMITGSGPQDRDETIVGHKPFLVIADYLTRNGIAVLRYDDRGVASSTGDMSNATLDNFARDALGAVAFLKGRDDIGSIGLIGHSEGGGVADRVATESQDVSWTIRMAGTSVSGREILEEQSRAIFLANGGSAANAATLSDINGAVYDLAMSDLDAGEFLARALELVDEKTRDLEPDVKTALGVDNAEAMLQAVSTPWFRHFLQHDPIEDLKRLDIPVLAIYGSKDTQVLATQNEPLAKREMRHSDSRTRVFENLNHLFQTTDGSGSPSEYGRITETINPMVLDELLTWIQTHG